MASRTRKRIEVRCAGCGKVIDPGEHTYQIRVGALRGSIFLPKSVFGQFHEKCFQRTVETPRTVLAELRAQAGKRV
jgi:DNA-directed RNA polymerase subunit N (RpoN/RPB10)